MNATTKTYQERITPWAIARLGIVQPNNRIVGRFYRRSDAEGHLSFLAQRFGYGVFVVVFDP